MRVAVVLAILVMAMTAGCTGSGTPEQEVTAATATPESSATTIPTAASAPTVAPDIEATVQGDHVALPADGTVPTVAPDIEATVQARVSADLTRVAPTPAPAKTDRPSATASGQALVGICYRTPALQRAILEMLDVELCQVVNEKELFRITHLSSLNMPSVKRGDFAGFVNVQSMTLRTGEIPGGHSPSICWKRAHAFRARTVPTMRSPGCLPAIGRERRTLRVHNMQNPKGPRSLAGKAIGRVLRYANQTHSRLIWHGGACNTLQHPLCHR